MATPAVKPVTAGKKTANTSIKPIFETGPTCSTTVALSGFPKKMDIKDKIINPKIKNCVFSAMEVLIRAIVVSNNNPIVPVIRIIFVLENPLNSD